MEEADVQGKVRAGIINVRSAACRRHRKLRLPGRGCQGAFG